MFWRLVVESGMKLLTIGLLIFLSSVSILAQTPAASPAPPPVKEATPADVGSLDAIMKAVYDVISGDAGQKRDWDRFRTLFHPDAKLIPTGKNAQTGVIGARFLSPEDYIQRAGPNLEKNGFHERELTRKVDQYGNIAQVFSTYLSFHKKDDKEPFVRGINSIQLLNDGQRWWVQSLVWQAETDRYPLPERYLKNP